VEKMTLWTGWLTCGARVVAAASEADRARGHGRRAGPRAGPTCCALAGLLAGLLRAGGPRSRAGPGCEAFSSFLFFSVFYFYSLDSNSNLVFKFGFQIGAPYSLEFLI